MTGQLLELRRFAMFSFGQLFVILTSQSVGLLIGSGMKLVVIKQSTQYPHIHFTLFV